MKITSETLRLAFSANYPKALFWSNLVKAVKFSLGNLSAFCCKIKQLVLAGFATTRHLQLCLATLFKAYPWFLKISPLIFNSSLRSMPSFLGNPPTKMPRSRSRNMSSGSDPVRTERISGYAQSWISRAKPRSTLQQAGMSSRRRWMDVSGPRILPLHSCKNYLKEIFI